MKILNRKNNLVEFSEDLLFNGILKASNGTKEQHTLEDKKKEVCSTVLELLKSKVKFPTTVDINSVIPKALISLGFVDTAEKFLTYATKHKVLKRDTKIDPITTVDEYVGRQDWRVKANANQTYSLGGMILNSSGKITANYWLNNVYPEDAAYAHINGDLHIHDLDVLSGYCLSPDTLIKTKEYGDITIKELADKGVENTFTVLAKDENGNTVDAEAFNARCTYKNREIVQLNLDNGETLKCTPDHRIMLKDGTYKQAKDLTVNDELASL